MARGAHKVNPVAFRIGVNTTWNSKWYLDKKSYVKNLLSDLKIKKIINDRLKAAGVGNIIIKRVNNKAYIDIYVVRPGMVIGRDGERRDRLKEEIQKTIKQEVEIKVFEIKHPEIVAKIVAETIALQCEKRINPKVAMAKAVEAAKETGLIKGIDIWVSGRIKGAEMARRETLKWGTVPRHSLRADIDYAFVEAQVPGSGKHGIKVWINKGEKSGYSID
ncbi:MAG: 30S ribosomal protein S3 [Candidatus Dojkabacteria bacterium]|nr:30S ribosomal protein S3 [Candidatus Dojkabacteria bacterium]